MRLPYGFSPVLAAAVLLVPLFVCISSPALDRPSTSTLVVAPTNGNFGNVTVGNSASGKASLRVQGSDSVTITSAQSSDNEFVISGISLPLTLSAGQRMRFTVTFTPQYSGNRTTTLTFVSNATNSPTTQALSGTGVASTHTVDLSWDPSTSQVSGYNVYRGTQTHGPYSQINTGLDPNTLYTDTTVSSGQTYYYVTTAVDSEGNESSYSNESQAIIPSPLTSGLRFCGLVPAPPPGVGDPLRRNSPPRSIPRRPRQPPATSSAGDPFALWVFCVGFVRLAALRPATRINTH